MATATMRIANEEKRGLTKRVPFTLAVLDVAACPSGKDRVWIYDAKQPGLGLMVTSTGSKAFYVYRKVMGRPQRVRLGAFPDITIDQARKLTQQTIGKISSGIDPMKERREARAKGMNLGELWTWFLDTWAKPRKRSWKADETRYNTHLKAWASRRLADITRTDIAALHHRVSKATSTTTANRVLALLSTMFNKARMIGWEKENPCVGVEKFEEHSRERFLSAEEMQRFFKALESDQVWGDLFKICLFTGARRGNVLSMEWSELNLADGQWAISGAKFKNSKPVVVHLPSPAIDILKSRAGNGSKFVFPGTGKTGHAIKPEPAWLELCKLAKLEDLRIHDLRRSMGSWLAAGNISTAIIGKVLGHSSQQATAIYARLNTQALRGPVDAAVAAMVAAGNSEEVKK